MITATKVRMYIRYNGDLEAWSHGSQKKERLIMNDADWYAIQSLLQDIMLVNGGQASDSYKDEIRLLLETECENDEAITLLIEESKRKASPRV